MDLKAYDAFFQGKLMDYSLPQEEIDKYLSELDGLPKPEVRKSGKW
ncbi:MAG: hypothetical protein HQ546_03670 [Planctomycetes bacterium]|nr:hypothetical protein [Planctomycetota bacterium]